MEKINIDVLVVGSGAGGLTSAIVAHDHGANTLVIEKTDLYGGTSATSGGGIWVPCNHLMKEHGQTDTSEDALNYLKACVGNTVPEERLKTYISEAPKMLKYLDDNSHVKFEATPYADYFLDKQGSKDGWRTLDPLIINVTIIGKDFFKIRPSHPQTVFFGFTVNMEEAKRLLTKTRGWQWIIAKLMGSYWLDIPFRLKTKRHRRQALGNALIGRCIKSMQERKIPIWCETSLQSLILEGDVITGAIVHQKDKDIKIMAKKAVILSAGGFESNQKMREKYLPQPTNKEWSATPGHNTGDTIQLAQKIGADLSLMDAVWWGPAVRLKDEDCARILFAERALPGLYIVNQQGQRFLNEAASYDEVGRKLCDTNILAWLIFDATARYKYAIGPILPSSAKPDLSLPKSIKKVLKIAQTIDELAKMIEVPLDKLRETITRVNTFSETGIDEDFGKGKDSYDRHYGDISVSPNPCLASFKKAPFYAFPLHPGDIGTKGGITTNSDAQALNTKGKVIQNLYAIGNNSASVMGYTYPGAGSTLGPAMTFGYIAARHAMGVKK